MTESNILRNHPAPGLAQLLTKLLVLCYVMSLSFQLHLTDKTLMVFYLFQFIYLLTNCKVQQACQIPTLFLRRSNTKRRTVRISVETHAKCPSLH